LSIERRVTRAGSPRFVARVKKRGRLVASRTFALKSDAVSWEREQYRALAFGEFIPPARSSTSFAEVASGFMESRRGQIGPHSWRTDRDNLTHLVRAWGSLPISSIGESEVLRFLTRQLEAKARSTVLRTRTTLSALFTFAIRERYVNRNPVRGVRLPPGKTRVSSGLGTFTEEELQATLARQREINLAMAEVTEFLSLTGVRWSELRALRVSDLVTAPIPAVRVSRAQSDGYAEKGTKTGRLRTVPLTARGLQIATAKATGRGAGDYLFTGQSGGQLRGNLFWRLVNGAETAPGRTIHDLRHYAASRWLRAGVPIHQVAKWLGHSSPVTTLKVYAHVLGEAQDLAALEQLNRAAMPDPVRGSA
jgi:integrase